MKLYKNGPAGWVFGLDFEGPCTSAEHRLQSPP